MDERIVELSVGDVLRIGERTLTVIDIDGDEVSFRIDELGEADAVEEAEVGSAPPPK